MLTCHCKKSCLTCQNPGLAQVAARLYSTRSTISSSYTSKELRTGARDDVKKSAAHQLGDRFSLPLPPPLRKGSSKAPSLPPRRRLASHRRSSISEATHASAIPHYVTTRG